MKHAGSVLFVIVFVLFIHCAPVRADYAEEAKACETGDRSCTFDEYKAFAERGDIRAQVNVGWIYYYGKGVLQDKSQAVMWYRKAAEQGDVTSMFNLAYAYEHGDGVQQNLPEARRWYGKAAGRKNATERLDFERLTKSFLLSNAAQERAATAWAEDKNVQSPKMAEEAKIAPQETVPLAIVMAHSAPADVPPARMPQKHDAGITPSPSVPVEAETFRNPHQQGILRAAQAGDTHAQIAVGWIYSSGKEIPVNKAEAARWYRLAAQKGVLDAQVALGWLYYEGQGVGGRDLKESALWYGKAAAQGDIKARQMLKRIQRLLRGN